MKKKFILLSISAILLLTCCSSLGRVYTRNKYSENRSSMIKKIMVIVNVPDKNPESAPLISGIAADIIRLKTNYLVYGFKTVKSSGHLPECSKDIEGIFLLSVEDAGVQKNGIFLKLKCELYKCSTGELLWMVQASGTSEPDNTDLKELTLEYGRRYKETAPVFAAPAFILIQDIINTLPDPDLTDDEVNIKIKLDARK